VHLLALTTLLYAAPTPGECSSVSDLLAERRFDEAAAAGERCWTADSDLDALSTAIQARIRLGHGAHAAYNLTLLELASLNRSPALEARIRPLVVTIGLQLDQIPKTWALARLKVRAVFLDDPRRGALLVDLGLLPSDLDERQLSLDPGRWSIELLLDGAVVSPPQEFTARAGEVVVFQGPEITVELPAAEEPEPLTERPLPRRPEEPWRSADPRGFGVTVGLSAASVMTLATSVPIFVDSGSQTTASGDTEAYLRAYLYSSARLWQGGTLVGAGLGGGVVALTELARAPKRAYIAELSGGAAIGLGALIASTVHMSAYKRETQERYDARDTTPFSSPEYYESHQQRELASGILFGLGTGLAVGAAVSLVSRALVQRRGARAPERARARRLHRTGLTTQTRTETAR
jgi:hypothetical protein